MAAVSVGATLATYGYSRGYSSYGSYYPSALQLLPVGLQLLPIDTYLPGQLPR